MIAPVRPLQDQHPAEQGAAQYGDIGAGLDQAGAAEHLVGVQMLRQDRIFDRSEEGRMDPHREQGSKQERDIVEQQARRPEQHDENLGRLDDADDLRLVAGVGELPGQRRQEEEGEDEQPPGNGAEGRLLLGIAIDAVDDQHDHGGAKEVVVERAQELGDEQGQEAPRPDEVNGVVHLMPRAATSTGNSWARV